MITKDKIVERLLASKNITTEEAVILLKENSGGFQKLNNYTTSDTYNNIGCPRGGTQCYCDGSCKR